MTIQKIKPTKLVFGHGTNDLDEPVKVNGRNLKFYDTWKSMLKRCYSEKYHATCRTYVGCSVCSSWLSLSTFKVWFDTNYRDNMELDKDILVKGNKIYSPEACRFVPHYINSLLLDAGAIRGKLPLGVSRFNSGYQMSCSSGNGRRTYRYHSTVEEAVTDYSVTKAAVVKAQVLRAFDEDGVKSDICCALLERKW